MVLHKFLSAEAGEHLHGLRVVVGEEGALPLVQRRDGRHIFSVQGKVKDVEILRHPLPAHRLGNHRSAIWAEVHPSLVTVPLNCDYSIPYGLLYALEPEEDILRVVVAIKK
ncbi:hypothetical protein [Breznakiella homolactica]|uniref:Uncharacterized protein n=1 Tax=Breznakiella homolactica TaxID=2798577 RepID=A0A7T8B9Z5_9SPIR|nr:hypothetical protein [Breznakiella homolactica]QQO07698.1 hypothetical protein JFL75_12165 [Breznakiella homolactica]